MSGPSQATTPTGQPVTIRRAIAADAEQCGRICFDAFCSISTQHNFPPDFPSPERSIHILATMFSHPGFFCIVAEQNGKIVGSNCLDERAPVAGLGPITIDPAAQNRTVGHRLMQAAMARASERRFAGVRLVQAAFHGRSLALYAKLGFAVREPLACMQGQPIRKTQSGYSVRAAQHEDVRACNDLCMRVHGHDRGGELGDAVQQGTAVLAESGGRIRAFASALAFFGYAVGETNDDLQALIASASEFQGPGILVPTRNAGLFRWCLENGLRVVQPMTLMSMGLYNEPAGAYLPSILF